MVLVKVISSTIRCEVKDKLIELLAEVVTIVDSTGIIWIQGSGREEES